MEMVGKVVRKEFRGLGVFEGFIESYDQSTGFFKITYEDGNSEEVDLSEATSLSHSVPHSDEEKEKKKVTGRKPKKRRRIFDDPGNCLDGSVNDDPHNSVKLFSGIGLGQNSNLGVSVNGDLYGNVRWNSGLDLNSNEGLNFDGGSQASLDLQENGSARGCIDLNLSVDDDIEDKLEAGDRGCSGKDLKKEERGFDLNLVFDDEGMAVEAELDVPFMNSPVQKDEPKQSTSIDLVEGIDLEKPCFDALQDNGGSNHVSTDIEGSLGGDQLKRESFSGTASDVVVDEANVNCKSFEVDLEEGGLEACTPVSHEVRSSGRRKRRKVMNGLHSPPVTPLRRSARRAKAMASLQNNEDGVRIMHGANVSSSGMSVISEERPTLPENEGVEDSKVLPSKVVLPPASTNLNLEGIPVLDLFSVYSCLRSFSTFLFLSPFGLEDFVAALRSKVANSLLDFIHVAILQILRKHLEVLSAEGSESACSCLRSLNWDLLDTVTWPIFMAEYLLFNGSQLKPDVCVARLKLFDGDYYQQPAEVKIAILQRLCDDIIEVEAVRTELFRRTIASNFGRDFDRNMNQSILRKTRPPMDAPGGALLNEDVADGSTDWNSDECCLCRMEGNLICCDGCPAAYHCRCVGVASSLLPVGEWFCPECVNRCQNSEVRPQKLIRGAELLGVDPHGRMFLSCFGYLLVSRSGDGEPLFDYYYKDDLNALIEVLQSSIFIYGSIAREIAKRLTFHGNLEQPRSYPNSVNSSLQTIEAVGPLQPLISLEKGATEDGLVTGKKLAEMVNPVTSSEGSAEVLQASGPIQTSGNGVDQTSPISNHVDSCAGDLASNRRGSGTRCQKRGCPRKYSEAKNEDISLVQPDSIYVNRYDFARIASSVAEVLALRSTDKRSQEIIKSEEEIISSQVKAISKNSAKFCWSSVHNMCGEIQREKCGWCYCCKYPEERDCLFTVNANYAIPEGLATELAVIQSKQNKSGHLVDVICQILSMEGRLRGLLLCPCLGPDGNKVFHKSVLKECEFALVKRRLLLLESNLHPLALSVEWGRHVDSAMTVGSASHIVVNSRISSKYGVGKKRSRFFVSEPKSMNGGGLIMLWWRGGSISCKLFSWKVLPRSLALRAARKGGCVKIPGLLYPDGSEYVKRSHQIAWRAAVETSTSVEQLALQVRELDSNIRWDDIENTRLLATLDKESQKSVKLFKKAIVRRKSKEGTVVKYLLDFGKRRLIPDVVVRRGSMLDDPTSERKKYWLQEPYVPLHLIKNFEERRIARKAGMVTTSKGLHGSRVLKKPSKRNCFDYLFARAERADNYQCGHCKKVVPISEAVSCQYCNGFFHKRHARASPTAVASKCTYTCHKCQSGKHVNVVMKKGKVRLQKQRHKNGMKSENGIGKVKSKRGRQPKAGHVQLPVVKKKRGRGRPPSKSKKKANVSPSSQSKKNVNVSSLLQSRKRFTVYAGMPLRRSERQAKNAPVNDNNSIIGGSKEEKLMRKSIIVPSMEPTKGFPWRKKRTPPLSSLWKNGLWLSRTPNDERITQFKQRKLFIPSEFSGRIDEHLKCTLCGEEGYTSSLKYIACESCGDWFHGDAFGLDSEIVRGLIGFRCHVCLKRDPPLCPHAKIAKGNGAAANVAKNNCGVVLHPEERNVIQNCGPEVDNVNFLQGKVIEAWDNFYSDKFLTMEGLDLKMEKRHAPSGAGQIAHPTKISEDFHPNVLIKSEESNVLEEGSQDPIEETLFPNGSDLSAVRVCVEGSSQDPAMESPSRVSEGKASTRETDHRMENGQVSTNGAQMLESSQNHEESHAQ